MKIGIYTPDGISPTEGGAYGYYFQLLSELLSNETKHQFVLLVGNNSQNYKHLFNREHSSINISSRSDAKLFCWKLLSLIGNNFSMKQFEGYFKNLYEQRLTKKLHDQGIQFIYNLPTGEYLTRDIPFLANVWDMGHRNVSHFPEISANGEFEKREFYCNNILPRAALIATESKAGKEDVEFYFRVKPEKIIVLPLFPGNVINVYVSKEEQIQWLKSKKLTQYSYLFYPAQFWAHKNHINLLKAIALLKQKFNITVPLVLSGSDKGNLKHIQKTISDLHLQNHVHCIGFVSEKEIRILYENALALIMPTFLGPTTMPI